MIGFDEVKIVYDWGLLDPELPWWVENGFITKEQYKELSGEDYLPQ